MKRGHGAEQEAKSRQRRSHDAHGSQTTAPTVAELKRAPELATLHAMDELNQVTLHALVAVHPELGDDETQIQGYTPGTILASARDIVYDVRRLAAHLRAYRAAIAAEQERVREAEHDLPF